MMKIEFVKQVTEGSLSSYSEILFSDRELKILMDILPSCVALVNDDIYFDNSLGEIYAKLCTYFNVENDWIFDFPDWDNDE